MMTMCMLACLEGIVLSIMASSRIDPVWMSPNLLAHTPMGLMLIHLLLPYSILKT
jgi:hypothetical protein